MSAEILGPERIATWSNTLRGRNGNAIINRDEMAALFDSHEALRAKAASLEGDNEVLATANQLSAQIHEREAIQAARWRHIEEFGQHLSFQNHAYLRRWAYSASATQPHVSFAQAVDGEMRQAEATIQAESDIAALATS